MPATPVQATTLCFSTSGDPPATGRHLSSPCPARLGRTTWQTAWPPCRQPWTQVGGRAEAVAGLLLKLSETAKWLPYVRTSVSSLCNS